MGFYATCSHIDQTGPGELPWDGETQDSKFEPWLSEVVHATSGSRRLPTSQQRRNVTFNT